MDTLRSAEKGKQERYVDDLADPGDYWLSITIEALLSQQAREREDALQGLNKEVAALSGLTQQVEEIRKELRRLDTSIEVARRAALGSQHRVDKQDELIAELGVQLAEEADHRTTLMQQAASRSPRRVSRAKEK